MHRRLGGVAASTGLAKSTVNRILQTMVREDFATVDDSGATFPARASSGWPDDGDRAAVRPNGGGFSEQSPGDGRHRTVSRSSSSSRVAIVSAACPGRLARLFLPQNGRRG